MLVGTPSPLYTNVQFSMNPSTSLRVCIEEGPPTTFNAPSSVGDEFKSLFVALWWGLFQGAIRGTFTGAQRGGAPDAKIIIHFWRAQLPHSPMFVNQSCFSKCFQTLLPMLCMGSYVRTHQSSKNLTPPSPIVRTRTLARTPTPHCVRTLSHLTPLPHF